MKKPLSKKKQLRAEERRVWRHTASATFAYLPKADVLERSGVTQLPDGRRPIRMQECTTTHT